MMVTLSDIQTSLASFGFDPGPIDGVWGPRTQAAVAKALERIAAVPTAAAAIRADQAVSGGENAVPGDENHAAGPESISSLFNDRSHRNLADSHPDLIRVMNEARAHFDFQVICGYRGRADQEAAVRAGRSKAHFGSSPHNYDPALAVDCIPEPFVEADWKDASRFRAMAGAIKAAAAKLKIPIEWGGDWKSFHDSPHFQLADWKQRRNA